MGQRGKHTIIFFDNSSGTPVNISGEVLEGANIPLTYDEIEQSGYGEDKNYLKGQGDAPVTLKIKFNDTTHPIFTHASTGALGSDTARTLTVQYGDNAAPTTGDPEIEGEYIVTSVEIENAKDGMRMMNVKFAVGPGAALPAYGTVA